MIRAGHWTRGVIVACGICVCAGSAAAQSSTPLTRDELRSELDRQRLAQEWAQTDARFWSDFEARQSRAAAADRIADELRMQRVEMDRLSREIETRRLRGW